MKFDQLKPLINNDQWYTITIIIAVCAILFALSFLIYSIYRSKRTLLASSNNNEKISYHDHRVQWRKQIDDIVAKYHKHELSYDSACAKLAKLARHYVSIMSQEDITTYTLSELNAIRMQWSNKKGADMLRQTISALYPTEFANPRHDLQVQATTVDQAAQWVLTLLESFASHRHVRKEQQ